MFGTRPPGRVQLGPKSFRQTVHILEYINSSPCEPVCRKRSRASLEAPERRKFSTRFRHAFDAKREFASRLDSGHFSQIFFSTKFSTNTLELCGPTFHENKLLRRLCASLACFIYCVVFLGKIQSKSFRQGSANFRQTLWSFAGWYFMKRGRVNETVTADAIYLWLFSNHGLLAPSF